MIETKCESTKMEKLQDILFIVALTIASVLIIMHPVMAMTITMASPGATEQKDVLVYYANGTLFGTYNTTSTFDITDTNTSYIFTMRPQSNNIIDAPTDWLNGAFDYVKSNITAIIIIFAALGILTRKWW